MLLRKIIIATIVPWSAVPAFSKTHSIVVQTNLKKFTLNYSKQKISIKGFLLNLNLTRKKCNSHIFDRFEQHIQSTSQKLASCQTNQLSQKLSLPQKPSSVKNPTPKIDSNQALCKNFLTPQENTKKKKALQQLRKKLSLADVRISAGDQSYTVQYGSTAGNIFLSLPSEIQRMKIEEKLICKTKPKKTDSIKNN